MQNLYLPNLVTIEDIYEETPDVRTFRLVFRDERTRGSFDFRAGQFGLYSALGYFQCTFRKTGRVTSGLFDLSVGDAMGFRGPYGNHFPVDGWKGKNIVFIAGGIGLPPVRSVIWNCLDKREEFGDITVVYGARTVSDLVYKNEIEHWRQRPDMTLITAVDPGGQTPDWAGKVGFVPTVLAEAAPKAGSAKAISGLGAAECPA